MTDGEQREALAKLIVETLLGADWDMPLPSAERLADAIFAAGYRSPESDEWEYGVRMASPWQVKIVPLGAGEPARRYAMTQTLGAANGNNTAAARRRKAGSWEEVPNDNS